jgi:WD40 repeat protein
MMRAVSRAVFKSVTGSPDRSLEGNENGTVAIAATADGKHLVSGSRLGDVNSWDLATQEALCSYRGHNGTITAIAITDDGRWAASAQEPKEITQARFGTGALPAAAISVVVKVWNAATGRERFSLPGHANRVDQLAFSRDGRLLASSGPDAVKIWDMATGKLLRELNHKEMQSGASDALQFSPDGDLLATAGQAVQLWDVASGRSTALIQGHRGKLQLAFSPDQSRLATAAGRQVKLWDVKTGQEALTLPFAQPHSEERASQVAALAWSADGQRLRAALRDGSVVEWDATPKEAR